MTTIGLHCLENGLKTLHIVVFILVRFLQLCIGEENSGMYPLTKLLNHMKFGFVHKLTLIYPAYMMCISGGGGVICA